MPPNLPFVLTHKIPRMSFIFRRVNEAITQFMHAAKTFKKCLENSNWQVFNNVHSSHTAVRDPESCCPVFLFLRILMSTPEGKVLCTVHLTPTNTYTHTHIGYSRDSSPKNENIIIDFYSSEDQR